MQQLDIFAFSTEAGSAVPDTGTIGLTLTPDPKIRLGDAIDKLAALLQAPLDERRLLDVAKECGFPDVQGAYNLVEGAAVAAIRAGADPGIIAAHMPTQRRRSDVKEALQQFSTPPRLAVLASRMAAATPNDIVLEPSAGTGLLVARIDGRLLLNEYDRARRAVLRHLFPDAGITNHDARYLDALLRGVRPTLTILNPPFSVDLNGADDPTIALDHVRAAVRLTQPGGRIVAIVGFNQHPSERSWEKVLGSDASLRLAVTVDGRDYYRMGTSFGVALCVIDKAPNLPTLVQSTDPQRVEDLEEQLVAIPRLTVRHETSAITTVVRGGRKAVAKRTFIPIFNDVISVPYRYHNEQQRTDLGRFATYAAQIECELVGKHPANLVESGALASVSLPPVDVELRLPRNALAALSDAQLETIVYAKRAFAQTFVSAVDADIRKTANEEQATGLKTFRKGIMVGHGTGFGKGRTLSGIILSEMLDGNKKAVWISENQLLMEDAIRDWTAVAGANTAGAFVNLTEINVRDKVDVQAGIIFCTYATLRQESRHGTRSRKEQLLEALGANFEGVIVADECHNLANVLVTKGERGKEGGSKQGMAFAWLQDVLPLARIIYTSATCATKADAYAYAPRLGLWGQAAPFKTREAFLETMNEGGVGALEMLTRDLKAQGLYIASALDMSNVGITRLEHELTPDQVEGYNAVAQAWRTIKANLRAAIEDAEKEHDSRSRSAALSTIASAEQRSIQSVLLAFKLATVVPYMEDMLAAGNAVVLQFTNTYEAAQERALAELDDEHDLDDLDMSAKRIITDYLLRAFPTAKMVTRVSADGKEYSEVLKDEDGIQVEDPELVALRDDLLAKMNGLTVPDAPLTILFEHFGSDAIAEVTGRKRRLVRKLVDGVYKRILEDRPGDASSLDTAAFQSGEKDILAFSEGAGGTGRSYHAARDCGNQKKRKHIVLQVGWRSDKAAQGLGRTLRSNSVCDPDWILATTNVPGERRFFSTLARRMEELGAASRGQRDAVNNGLFNAADNLETIYGAMAVKTLLHDIVTNGQPISYATWREQTNESLTNEKGEIRDMPVPRFLNKVLTCDISENGDGPQNKLMDAMMERMVQIIQVAKDRGTYDEGVTVLKALSVTVSKREVIHTSTDGAVSELLTLAVKTPAHKRTFGEVLSRVRASRERFSTWEARFGETEDGAIVALYRIADVSIGGAPKACYNIVEPGRSYTVLESRPWFREVSDEDAEPRWKASVEAMEDTITSKQPLLTGSILPIFHSLPTKKLNVVKLQTDEGERHIGIMLRSDEAMTLLERLGLRSEISLNDVVEELRHNRKTAYYGDWQIKAVRLAQEQRIELIVPPYSAGQLVRSFSAAGVQCERVQYQQRFFIPEDATVEVLERVLAGRQLTALS